MERGKIPKEVHDMLVPILSELKPDVVKFTRLIEVLLDFSKHGGTALHLSIESCDMSKIILEEVERLRPEFLSHKTELIVKVQEKILGECDQVRVQQVVANLLNNALKFGNSKPVYLTVTGTRSHIHIEVMDKGIGISGSDIDRIFKPFERAVSDKHFGGLGLGLYITKQIVDRHNGKISVESKPGEGTTFLVTLPLQAKA
jgi:signal transduction histidine kinase